MTLSKTAKYALRAVVYLAQGGYHAGRRASIRDITQALDVPPSYLSKVMHQLARAGVVESMRGPGGGFWLEHDPATLVVSRVIAPFEDTEGPIPCLLKDRPCDPDRACIAHHRWAAMARTMRAFFDETTVKELLLGAPEPPAPITEASGTVDPGRL